MANEKVEGFREGDVLVRNGVSGYWLVYSDKKQNNHTPVLCYSDEGCTVPCRGLGCFKPSLTARYATGSDGYFMQKEIKVFKKKYKIKHKDNFSWLTPGNEGAYTKIGHIDSLDCHKIVESFKLEHLNSILQSYAQIPTKRKRKELP